MTDVDTELDSLANPAPADVKEPTPVPIGTWTLQILNGANKPVTRDGGPAREVRFNLRAIEPGDDVNPEMLEQFAPNGTAEEYAAGRVSSKIAIWEESSWYVVKRFLMNAGIDADDYPDMNTAIAAAKGAYIQGIVEWNESKDGVNFAEVKTTAPVEG